MSKKKKKKNFASMTCRMQVTRGRGELIPILCGPENIVNHGKYWFGSNSFLALFLYKNSIDFL